MFALALLAAAAVLVNLVSGAVLTNAFAIGTANAPGTMSIFSVLGHRYVSEAAGTLVVILAAWVAFASKNSRAKVAGGLAVVCVAGEAVLGVVSAPLSAAVGFLHAVLAQILLVLLVAVAMYTSPGWQKEPVPVPDKGWPSLRGMSTWTLGALLLQVSLGAAFRHNLLGVLWHILCAFVVVVFGLAMLVIITQVPTNRPLRAPAIWLGCLLGAQVTLGMVLISISQPEKHPAVSASTVAAHVLIGASAFGVGMIMAMMVRRSVRAAEV